MDDGLRKLLPTAATTGLELWESLNTTRLQFLNEIDSFSDAVVVLVQEQPQAGPTRQLILKATRLGDHATPTNHNAAVNASPTDFTLNHLTHLAYPTLPILPDYAIMFQYVAGASISRVTTLSTLAQGRDVPHLVSTVISSILSEWNAITTSTVMTPSEIFRGAARLNRSADIEQLREGLVDTGIDVPNAAWIRFAGPDSGAPTPNAAVWPVHDDIAASTRMSVVCGNVHGDLHTGNVLVPLDPEPVPHNFRLIDLSTYSSAGPIALDVARLLMTVIRPFVTRDNASVLADVLVSLGQASSTLASKGIDELVKDVITTADQWIIARSPSIRDDWRDSIRLALAGEAVGATRWPEVSAELRSWLFQISCKLLKSFVDRRDFGFAADDVAAAPLINVASSVDDDVHDALDDVLASFDSSIGTVLVVPEEVLSNDASSQIGLYPWDLIVTYDVNVDSDGEKQGPFVAATNRTSRVHRLRIESQPWTFAQTSTTWYAANGLQDSHDSERYSNLRAWRLTSGKALTRGFRAYAAFTPKPVTMIVLGQSDARTQHAVESAIDALGDRLRVVQVARARDSRLDEYCDTFVEAVPSRAVFSLPSRAASLDSVATQPSLPGRSGDVELASGTLARLSEGCEVLHSLIGREPGGDRHVGRDFYRGQEISWFELGRDVDVRFGITDRILTAIRDDLSDGGTRRIFLSHFAGAGGTTLGRRIAWELHLEVPTLYTSTIENSDLLVESIRQAYSITQTSVFAVLDSILERVVDDVFDSLRGAGIQTTILVINRRSSRPPTTASTRSFFLGTIENEPDRVEMAERYAEYRPQKKHALVQFATRGQSPAVPFFFGLTAFEDGFDHLESYVRSAIEKVTNSEKPLIVLAAISHYYAGLPLPSQMFAGLLGLDRNVPIKMHSALGEGAAALLLEDKSHEWRTSHPLVAQEILSQMLVPASKHAESWRTNLSRWSQKLIDHVAECYGTHIPRSLLELLDKLFIVRDSKEAFTSDSPRGRYSELVSDVPSSNGRIELFEHLTGEFNDNPHYWAHYARILSYEVQDAGRALECMNLAIDLDDTDPILFHMRGIVRRNAVLDIIRRGMPVDDEVRQEVRALTVLALDDFAKSVSLAPDSEYGHVATVQTCTRVINWAFDQSGESTYGVFLGTASPWYVELLELAEASLESLEELAGPSDFSQRAEEAQAEFSAVYDNPSAVIDGLYAILSRRGVEPAPVRKRIVKAYRRMYGDWADFDADTAGRSLALLEENLLDNPYDLVAFRYWWRLARLSGASLAKAGELVAPLADEGRWRESLFYDYVIASLQAIEGMRSAVGIAERKLMRCRDMARRMPVRKHPYEWLGTGRDGMSCLVRDSNVDGEWKSRSHPLEDPTVLRRVNGRVERIDGPQAGVLRTEEGVAGFFVPSRVYPDPVVAGRDENRRVSFLLGFSYDNVRCWSVARS